MYEIEQFKSQSVLRNPQTRDDQICRRALTALLNYQLDMYALLHGEELSPEELTISADWTAADIPVQITGQNIQLLDYLEDWTEIMKEDLQIDEIAGENFTF